MEKGEKKSIKMSDVMAFCKKNMYLILMIVCILALGAVVTIAAVVNSKEETPLINEELNENNQTLENNNQEEEKKEDNKVDKPSQSEPVIKEEKFYISAPIANYSLGEQFSNTALVWSATQKHWATHEGVDFKANAGDKVKCVYDGIVKSVNSDSYNGTMVCISHSNGYESVYKLLQNVTIKSGDKVSRGQIIGEVSKDALYEVADGPHLHFELLKDGKRIDPLEYLLDGGK